MKSHERGWIVLWELVIRAYRRGFRFVNVPVERRQRTHGLSKGNTWRNAFSQLQAMVKLKLRLIKSF